MNNGSVGKLLSKLIKWKNDLLNGYYKIDVFQVKI